jgi:hypothetical protein
LRQAFLAQAILNQIRPKPSVFFGNDECGVPGLFHAFDILERERIVQVMFGSTGGKVIS